jgi:hypothetical protein
MVEFSNLTRTPQQSAAALDLGHASWAATVLLLPVGQGQQAGAQ